MTSSVVYAQNAPNHISLAVIADDGEDDDDDDDDDKKPNLPTLEVLPKKPQRVTEGGEISFIITTSDNSSLEENISVAFTVRQGWGEYLTNSAIYSQDGRGIASGSFPRPGQTLAMQAPIAQGHHYVNVTFSHYNDEADETPTRVTLTLVDGTGYNVLPQGKKASYLIIDDDPQISLSAEKTELLAGEEAKITVTASKRLNAPNDIYLSMADPNHVMGDSPPAYVHMASGRRSQEFTMPTMEDVSGTVVIRLATSNNADDDPVTAYRPAPSAGAGRILIAASASPSVVLTVTALPRLEITAQQTAHISEGDNYSYSATGNSTFRVASVNGATLAAGSQVNLRLRQTGSDYIDRIDMGVGGTVNQSFTPSDAININTDFTFTVPETANEFLLTIVADDDALDETLGNISLSLLAGDNYSLANTSTTASIVIHDNDPAVGVIWQDSIIAGQPSNITLFANVAAAAMRMQNTIQLEIDGTVYGIPILAGSNSSVASIVIDDYGKNVTARILQNRDLAETRTPYGLLAGFAEATATVLPPLELSLAAVGTALTRQLTESDRGADAPMFDIVPNVALTEAVPLNLRITRLGTAGSGISNQGDVVNPSILATINAATSTTLPAIASDATRNVTMTLPPASSINQAPFASYRNSISLPANEIDQTATTIYSIELLGGADYRVNAAANQLQLTIADDDPALALSTHQTEIEAGQPLEFTITNTNPFVLGGGQEDNIVQLQWTGTDGMLVAPPPTQVTLPRLSTNVTFNVTTNSLATAGNISVAIATNSSLGGAVTPYRIADGQGAATVQVNAVPTLSLQLAGVVASRRVFESEKLDKAIKFDILPNTPLINEKSVKLRVSRTGNTGDNFGEDPAIKIITNTRDPRPPGLGPRVLPHILADQVWEGNITLPPASDIIDAPTDGYRNIIAAPFNAIDQDAFTNYTIELLPSDDYVVNPQASVVSAVVFDDDPPISISTNASMLVAGEAVDIILTAHVPASQVLVDNEIVLEYDSAVGAINGTPPTKVTLPAGQNSTRVSVATLANVTTLAPFSVRVLMTDNASQPPTPYSLVAGSSEAQLQVTPPPPALEVAFTHSGLVTEAASATGGIPFVIRTQNRQSVAYPFSVPLRISNNGGVSLLGIEFDFALASNGTLPLPNSSEDWQVAFPAGRAEISGVLFPLADSIDGESSNISLTIMLADGNTASVLVVDDDPAIGISANSTRILPGESVLFTVATASLATAHVNNTIQLRYSYSDGLVNASDLPTSIVLPVGSDSTQFAVPTNADGLGEAASGNITAEVVVSNSTDLLTPYSVAMGQAQATVTVWIGMPPVFAISNATADEGHGHMEFVVTLSHNVAHETSVTYTTTSSNNSSATAGADYTETTGIVRFAANQRNATIQVPLVDDSLDEADESFSLRLLAATPADSVELATATASGVIVDNDASVGVGLVIPTAAVIEGAEAVFTIAINTTSGRGVSVDYTTGGGSATANSDYTATNGTVYIAPGTLSREIRVATIDDAEVFEGNETFHFTIHNPINASFVVATTTEATIIDNDIPIIPSLSVGDVEVDETAGAAVFTITMSQNTSIPVAVDFTTASIATGEVNTRASEVNDTRSGDLTYDYTANSSRVLIAPGATTAQVSVAINDDQIDEPNQSFHLRLSNPANATLADDLGLATIIDDEARPHVGLRLINNATEGGQPAMVGIFFDRLTEYPMDITYRYVDGSARYGLASAGGDYYNSNGTARQNTLLGVTAHALADLNGSAAELVMPAQDDSLDEAAEDFRVLLMGATNAILNPSAEDVTVTIFDNDPPPSLSITATTNLVGEGEAAVFTITLDAPSGKGIRVDYSTGSNGDTATIGSDYASTNGSLYFAAGATKQTLQVASLTDTLDETSETFTLTISNPVNATLATPTATATISDVPPATIDITPSTATLVEGATQNFTIRLSQAQNTTLSLLVATEAGTATAGADYTAINQSLQFAPGETEKSVAVTTIDDLADEPAEEVVIRLSQLNAGTALVRLETAEARLTIADNDEPLPTIRIDNGEAQEGNSVTIAVTLSAAAILPAQVDYATSGGTAESGVDFTAQTGTLIFQPGESSKTITVPITLDNEDEATEEFTITLSGAENATFAFAPAIATIRITNQPRPTLSLTSPVAIEGDVLEFTASLATAWPEDLAMRYATLDGSATAGEDYVAATGRIEFPANSTVSQTISIATTADTLYEGANETVTLLLSSDGDANAIIIGNITSLGTIVDGDTLPQLIITGGSTVEGQDAVFTITSVGALSSHNLTIGLRMEGMAGAGDTQNYSITMPAKTRQMEFRIPTHDDNITANTAEITAVLLSSSDYALGDQFTASVVVHDNDATTSIADEANDAILPRLASHTMYAIADAIGSRLNSLLQPTDNRSRGNQITIDGRTLQQFAHSQAQAEAAENPWDAPSTRPSDFMPASFTLSVAGDEYSDHGGASSLWGQGYQSQLSGSEDGMAYDGDIGGGMLGFDGWLAGGMLAGLGISQTEADFAFTTNGTSGNYQADLTAYHPYAGWRLANGGSVWAALGIGSGEVQVTHNASREATSGDLAMGMLGLGFDNLLASDGNVQFHAIGEAALSQWEISGDGAMTNQDLDAAYTRLGLAIRHHKTSATTHISQALEAAVRYDIGDAYNGAGLEVKGRLTATATDGVSLDLTARTLLTHAADIDDWGVAAAIRLPATGKNGHGLTASFTPEWGSLSSQSDAVWGGGLAGITGMPDGNDAGYRYRLDVRYGIGLFGDEVLLTPFARRDTSRVNLGADIDIGKHFAAGYEVVLPTDEAGGEGDNRLFLKYQREF